MKRTYRAILLTRLCIASVICVCSISSTAEATAQFTDLIVIEGRSEQLFTEPLEPALYADPELRYNLLLSIPGNGCSVAAFVDDYRLEMPEGIILRTPRLP